MDAVNHPMTHPMSRPMTCFAWLRLFTLLLALGLGSVNASAHEGHDHGEPPPATTLPSLAPRAEASGDLFELLLRLDGAQLTLWVDRFASNEPVTTARVEVEGPGWKAAATPAADGSYRLDAPVALRQPGAHPLVLTVQLTGPQGEEADLLETTLRVPDPQGAPAITAAAATKPPTQTWTHSPLAWGAAVLVATVILLAAGLGIRRRLRRHAQAPLLVMLATTAVTLAIATLTPSAQAHGGEDHSHDQPQAAPTAAPVAVTPGVTAATGPVERPQRLPDGRVFLPKTSQRRLELRTTAAEAGQWPRSRELLGQVVADPQSGGRVQAAQAGRIAPAGAQGLPMPGQRVQRGQVLALLLPLQSSAEAAARQAEIAELGVKLELTQRQLERARSLSATVPRREIEALEAELTAQRARQAALATGQKAEALSAPVSGVLVGAPLLTGQVVEAREALFEIADPQRLLVEALLPDPAQAQGLRGATLAEGGAALQLVGRAGALRDGSLPLWFRLTPTTRGAPTPGLTLNQPLRVLLQLGEAQPGVALPREALQRNAANESVVWLHERAEIFRPQVVQVQPLDGQRVRVQGLSGGERVVTQGAALLQQIR